MSGSCGHKFTLGHHDTCTIFFIAFILEKVFKIWTLNLYIVFFPIGLKY